MGKYLDKAKACFSLGKSKGVSFGGIIMLVMGIVFTIIAFTSILPDYIAIWYNTTWAADVPTYWNTLWDLSGLLILIAVIVVIAGFATRRR